MEEEDLIQVRDLDKEYGSRHLSDEGASTEPSSKGSSSLNLGWLLRLFKSDFFDAWMAVTYLYKYRGSTGVQDYLCNELYSLNDADLETYLPQIWYEETAGFRDSQMLEKFVIDKCADSVHLALQVYWFLEAAVEDARRVANTELILHCQRLRNRCETAAINGGIHSIVLFAQRSAGIFETDVRIGKKVNETGDESSFHLELSLSETEKYTTEVETVVSALQRASELAIQTPPVPIDEDATDCGIDEGKEEYKGVRSPTTEESFGDFQSATPLQALQDSVLFQEAKLTTGEEFPAGADPLPESIARPDAEMDPSSLRKNQSRGLTPLEKELDSLATSDPSLLVGVRQERFSYFDDTLMIVKRLVKYSLEIRELPIEDRPSRLKSRLESLNHSLLRRMAGPNYRSEELIPEVIAANGEFSFLRSIHLPLVRADEHVLRVLRINPDETIILNTKTKAPYMLFIEVVETKMRNNDIGIFAEHFFAEQYIEERKQKSYSLTELEMSKENGNGSAIHAASPGTQFYEKVQVASQNQDPNAKTRQMVKQAVYGDAEHVNFGERLIGFETIAETIDQGAEDLSRATAAAVFGEMWKDREERVLHASPFGVIPGVKLKAFIVKAGDDLRQEQLAVQLIAQFKRIFEDEDVDLFVRPFTIMCSNADSGLIECLTDAVSLHSLKKKTPNFVSVRDFFERAYAPVSSIRFQQAQKRFTQSMAAYSLISYFLQILDRHNGNIMLDAQGRVIHIDFGFMLGNSPGAIRFESAPFKLTEELLEVMASRNDQAFSYFKELFVLGFLAARKHHEKIITLVEVMIEGTSMPCMLAGYQVVEDLRARFFLGLPERECIAKILSLVDESYNNWRSKQYDRFQYMTNGIL